MLLKYTVKRQTTNSAPRMALLELQPDLTETKTPEATNLVAQYTLVGGR